MGECEWRQRGWSDKVRTMSKWRLEVQLTRRSFLHKERDLKPALSVSNPDTKPDAIGTLIGTSFCLLYQYQPAMSQTN